MIASNKNHIEIVKALVTAGASVGKTRVCCVGVPAFWCCYCYYFYYCYCYYYC